MNYIYKTCLNNQISMQQLARNLNVSIEKLSFWVQEDQKIHHEIALQIADILHVTLDELFLGTTRPAIDISMLDINDIDIIYSLLEKDHLAKYIARASIRKKNKYFNEQRDLGDRIKFVRVNILGLSQKDLAAYFGFSRSTTKYWDEGRNIEYVQNIRMIAKKAHISMDYFIKDDYPLSISSYEMSDKKYDTIVNVVDYLKDRHLEV